MPHTGLRARESAGQGRPVAGNISISLQCMYGYIHRRRVFQCGSREPTIESREEVRKKQRSPLCSFLHAVSRRVLKPLPVARRLTTLDSTGGRNTLETA